MEFKPYSGNGKPFVYAMFAPEDSEYVMKVLLALRDKGYEVWPSTRFDKMRIKKSALVLLLLSPAALENYEVNRTITYAVQMNNPLLVVHIAPVSLTPAQRLLLNTQQGILRHDCASEEAFLDKLVFSTLMRNLQVTTAQKRAASWTTWGLSGVILLTVAFTVVLATQVGAKVSEDSLLAKLGYSGRMSDIEHVYLYGESVDEQRSDTSFIGTEIDYENHQKNPAVFFHGNESTAHFGSIEGVSDFSQLKNLKELTVAANLITDASPLWALRNLEYLDLTGNPIRDISGIENLSRLKELCISGTQIVDIAPLVDCRSLKKVFVDETQYAKFEDNMDGMAFDLVVVGPVEEMRSISCHIFGGVEEIDQPNLGHYSIYIRTKSNNHYLSYDYEVSRNGVPLDITQIQYFHLNDDLGGGKTHLSIDVNQMFSYDPTARYTVKITCKGYSVTYQIWHKYDAASKFAGNGNLIISEGF